MGRGPMGCFLCPTPVIPLAMPLMATMMVMKMSHFTRRQCVLSSSSSRVCATADAPSFLSRLPLLPCFLSPSPLIHPSFLFPFCPYVILRFSSLLVLIQQTNENDLQKERKKTFFIFQHHMKRHAETNGIKMTASTSLKGEVGRWDYVCDCSCV